MANQQPWAVLLCKYKDDPNDPAQTSISDLAKQWKISFGNPEWVPASWDNDNRTILSLYQSFFTPTGLLTFNMIQFFSTMSHRKVYLDDTQIFTCTLDRTIAEAKALAANPGGTAYQNDTFKAAKAALSNQHGVNWKKFYAIIVSFQYPDFGSQGGTYDGGPGVFMDIRYVKNNGSMRWGHEMGHAFGLDHSRADSPDPNYNPIPCKDGPPDYRDPWDTMSAECDYNTPDPDYTKRGPGLNAWNMRCRGWLDETRVWNCPQNQFPQTTLQLRPLHRIDLPGFLAAELPPYNANGNFPKYLVEYRIKSDWDLGIPRSAVFVHRFDGNLNVFMGTHSYTEFGTGGNPDMIDGDVFNPGTGIGPFPMVKVIKIDDQNFTADIQLSYLPQLPKFKELVVGFNIDKRLEVFTLGNDGAVYHKWQNIPNGSFDQWAGLAGNNIQQIVVGENQDGRVELFALGGDKAVYHIWQTAPNGDWGQWASLAGHDLRQISVARNQDGRLELFALGGDKAVYHVWQTAPNGNWSPWAGLAGHDLQQITVAQNQDGRLEVFALGGDKAVYHIWQAVPNGNFGAWAGLAGHDLRQITVAQNQDGRLEVFALGGDKAVYHIWQVVPNGNFGNWAGLAGHNLQQITVARNQDGRLELFALGGDKAVYHIWQAAPNGNFGAWASLQGNNLQQIAVAQNQDGRLELFAIGGDGAIYHRWQVVANGDWDQWFGI